MVLPHNRRPRDQQQHLPLQLQQLQQWFLRIQGRQLALYLLGICCFFSLLSAYHFDLDSGSGADFESLFSAPIHARTVMNLQDVHEKDNFQKNDWSWDEAYDDNVDYRQCGLNAASQAPSGLTNGCWTDNANTKMAICRVQDLQVFPEEKISGPPGGEALKDVMGREEDLEFPSYQLGAFKTPHAVEFKTSEDSSGSHSMANRDYWFYLVDVFWAMDMNQSPRQKCTETWNGVSLLITRYEYVDLYHTIKDWWNAFLVLSAQVAPDASIDEPDDVMAQASRVVFLDSHAEGQLDPVWQTLFGSSTQTQVERIKQIPDGTCMEHAWFVPSGYSSVLWPLGRVFKDDTRRCPSMAHAFVDHVCKTHNVHHLTRPDDPINIVIVHQPKHHILHPRSAVGASDADSNEKQQFWSDVQAKLLDDTDASSVQIVDLHKMHFKAQLKLIRRAHVLIGYSGSDHLTLGFFLPDNSTVIEVTDGLGGEDLSTMLKWRPSITHKSVSNTLTYLLPEIKDVLTPGWDENVARYPEGDGLDGFMGDDDQFNSNNNYTGGGDDFNNEMDEWDYDNSNITPEDLLRGNGRGYGSADMKNQDLATDYQQCAIYQGAYQVAKQQDNDEEESNHLHGCHVDTFSEHNSNIPMCCLHNVQFHASQIDFHGITGGEFLDTVMGRNETLEYPTWNERAATVAEEWQKIPGDDEDAASHSQLHYLKDILNVIKVVPDKECTITWSEPTLLIQRYEYVDSFRTLNDWWNTFWSMPSASSDSNPPLILFLDSHAQGHFDPVWNKVFGPTQHLAQAFGKETKTDGVLCIPHATLVPSGYASPLARSSSSGGGDDDNHWKPCPAMTQTFVHHFLKAYQLQDIVMDPLRLTIIEAPTDFITHPRQTSAGKDVSSFQMTSLSRQISEKYPELKLKIVQLEKMSFSASLKLVRQSHVVLIDEGASSMSAMALLFASQGAHVLDLNTADQINAQDFFLSWLPSTPSTGTNNSTTTYRYELFNNYDTQEDQVTSVLFPILEYAIWNRTNITTTTKNKDNDESVPAGDADLIDEVIMDEVEEKEADKTDDELTDEIPPDDE